jgi:hypothetical protein
MNRVISRMPETALQRDSHDRGCGCAACRQIQMQRDTVQRDDTPVKEETKTEEKSAAEAFELATLGDKKKMEELAKAISAAEFKELAKTKAVPASDTIIALIKYFAPLKLTDLEPLIALTDADGKKAIWSDASLMTKAEGKLGTDDYLTFATRIGMSQPPTTDELGEGGKEHTKAPEADKLIRDKFDKYVADAVKEDRKIEGWVAVVDSADWDRAGIAHYGEATWKTGPPPN